MEQQTFNPENVIIQFRRNDLERVVREQLKDVLRERDESKPKAPDYDPDKLYTITELSEKFKVSRIAVWKWRKKKLLKHTIIGNSVRFREADIREFIKLYNPGK